VLERIKSTLHSQRRTALKIDNQGHYDIPRLEVASELPAPSDHVLSGSVAELWRLLELTFESIAATTAPVRDAAVEQVYAERYARTAGSGQVHNGSTHEGPMGTV
jgi:hypothetical protein